MYIKYSTTNISFYSQNISLSKRNPKKEKIPPGLNIRPYFNTHRGIFLEEKIPPRKFPQKNSSH
jgi:hypothetical protein